MDDLISREAAIDALMEILDRPHHAEFLYTDEICKALNELPSVQPARPRGKWILSDEQRQEDVDNNNFQFYCSECGHGDLQSKSVTVPYCWKCGAIMSYEERPDAKIH